MTLEQQQLSRIFRRRYCPGDRPGDPTDWQAVLDRVGWAAIALIVAAVVALAFARECSATPPPCAL